MEPIAERVETSQSSLFLDVDAVVGPREFRRRELLRYSLGCTRNRSRSTPRRKLCWRNCVGAYPVATDLFPARNGPTS